MKISAPKKFLLSTAAGLFALGIATQAYAFCFSNDSLSNATMTVQQMDRGKVLQTISDISRKIANTSCNALTVQEKLQGRKTQDCNEIKKTFAKIPGALKDVDRELRNNQYTGPAVRTLESAANDVYTFVAGAPVTGDAINMGGQIVNAAADAARKAGREFVNLGKQLVAAVDKLTSARFRQTVRPDDTKCCSYKDRDCNPSGKKDAKIYFKVNYAGTSRIMHIGATDHVECRIDSRNPKATGCKNYVFPYSPYRAHKTTTRGMLIKSLHSGKCLDVAGWNKNNGANVVMWKCTGQKNQRWSIYRNGTIRSEMNWKCLDVAGAVKAAKDGDNVHLWDCTGSRNQRWSYGRSDKIISGSAGRYNRCLEIAGGNKNDKANVQVWRCHNGNHTRWRAAK